MRPYNSHPPIKVIRSLAIGDDITTFRQVQEKQGLILTEDSQFFTEWMAELPALSETEKARLDQVRRNYLYQISDGILLEETIKMVVLANKHLKRYELGVRKGQR